MDNKLQKRLNVFKQSPNSLKEIGRGIEREALRIAADGTLSQADHPIALGRSLTHSSITTDFAESLLEFITPVAKSQDELFNYLNDIHRFTLKNLDNKELLWPMSMPCFLKNEDEIQTAKFGSSNIGQKKEIYRKGLKKRYGSAMQSVAGVHYNFSLSDEFWKTKSELENVDLPKQDYISAGYMGIARNIFRYGWVVPYLFGASPAVCRTYLNFHDTNLKFSTLGKCTSYLPFATSLRLSELGYTSKFQSKLEINFNSVEEYLSSVGLATQTKSTEFEKFGLKDGSEHVQLSTNLLQGENELYAIVRPKRVVKSNESTSDALKARGVEYIELRSVDINPFAKFGIEQDQASFLDLFLTWCAIIESNEIDNKQMEIYQSNFQKVVLTGRDPKLEIEIDGTNKSIPQWGEWICGQLGELAILLDEINMSDRYKNALDNTAPLFADPKLTNSAKLLSVLEDEKIELGELALKLAAQHKNEILTQDYKIWSKEHFETEAVNSIAKRIEIEESDTLTLDEYLAQN